MGTVFVEGLFYGLLESTASNKWDKDILEEEKFTFDSLFSVYVNDLDQIIKVLTLKKDTLLKEECAIFRGSRAIAGPVGLMLLCYHALVSSKIFSCVFCGPKACFLGISWHGFSGCNIFSCWLHKYITISPTEYSISNRF